MTTETAAPDQRSAEMEVLLQQIDGVIRISKERIAALEEENRELTAKLDAIATILAPDEAPDLEIAS